MFIYNKPRWRRRRRQLHSAEHGHISESGHCSAPGWLQLQAVYCSHGVGVCIHYTVSRPSQCPRNEDTAPVFAECQGMLQNNVRCRVLAVAVG